MFDGISLAASCIAVGGLGLTIAKTIDTLCVHYADAPDTLFKLRNNAIIFYNIVNNIRLAAETFDEGLRSQFRPTVANSEPILRKTQKELDFVISNRKALRRSISRAERLATVWNDEQLKECSGEIAQQCAMFSALYSSYVSVDLFKYPNALLT